MCEYILEGGGKCLEPVFARSFCEAHYRLCYDAKKTLMTNRRHVERLADLPEIPYTPTKKGDW